MKERTWQLVTQNLREYYQQRHANKLVNPEEMDIFLETQNLPRLNHEEIKNLKSSIMKKETETVIKYFPTKESLSPVAALEKSPEHVKENWPAPEILLKQHERREHFQFHCTRPGLPWHQGFTKTLQENRSPTSLMNTIQKPQRNTGKTRFNSKLKGLYTMTESDLFLECNNGSTDKNQPMCYIINRTNNKNDMAFRWQRSWMTVNTVLW